MYRLPPSPPFDWARAIERNRDALTAILATLIAMLGLTGTAPLGRIPRLLHRTVLRVLRPAESATRRLIVIAARGLVLKPVAPRPMPQGGIAGKSGTRRPSFPLFDPRKHFDLGRRPPRPRFIPRITTMRVDAWGDTVFTCSSDAPRPKARARKPDDGQVDATRLARRLEALKAALADLPRQAKRLVRARARRDKVPRLQSQSPMRPGLPPGYRKRSDHDVDDVLKECHALARDALRPDTS
jgi:hypothetical protein